MKSLSRKRAIHVMVVYTGGCNGCDIEIVAAVFSPIHDLEQYNVMLTWNPREADILLVTGPVTRKCAPALKAIYEAIPEPKVVAAIGSCAVNGNVFKNLGGDFGSSWEIVGPVDQVIHVDAKVPGCPPRPEDIISAGALAIGILAGRED